MRTLEELINNDEPGWPIVQEWISLAKNKVEIIPSDRQQAGKALVNVQVTTRSLMGAIIYETGGLLIDNGWIRVLGSGGGRMRRSLPEWNKGKTFNRYGEIPPYLLIADDAIGGLYALNGGFLGKDAGNIYYFAPDSLNWEPMKIGYSQFLLFCFETDMNQFYEGLRWKGWEEDVKKLSPDYAYSSFPYLWTKEGKDINNISRRAVPMNESYDFNMEMKITLNKPQ